MYETLNYETDRGIATLTFNRPEVYNAFNQTMIFEINEALRRVQEDDGVYVLVVTGAEKGFCSGADVNDMPNWSDRQEEEYTGYLSAVQNVVRQLRNMSKPNIAAVNGPAIGAGCDFALACDMRIVGPRGLMREGFVNVGLISGDGGGWLLPRLIGEARAREYMLTGKDIPPEEAVEIGLAVEQADDPLQAALDLAEELRDLPALAVRRTKQLIDADDSFEDYCQKALEYQWDCVNDEEHEEAVEAFQQKREPRYDRDYS